MISYIAILVLNCNIFLFILGTRFHDFHHKNFLGNYSSTFYWWDWLFGTDRQYREFVAQQKAQQQTKKSQ